MHSMRQLTDRLPHNYQGSRLLSGEGGRLTYMHKLMLSYISSSIFVLTNTGENKSMTK